MKKTLITILLAASLVLPLIALAEVPQVPPSGKSVVEVLDALATKLLLLVGIAAVILLIAAGFQFLTAGGDPEKVSSARDKVIYALIGVLIAGMAWALVRFVVSGVL